MYERVLTVRPIISAIVLLAASHLSAKQELNQRSALEVTVFDSQHKAVAGATVELNATSKPSDEDGRAEFAGLRPATYQLSVSKQGFQPLVKMSVLLAVGDQKKIEVTLAPALTHRESVDVQGAAEKLDPAGGSQQINTSAARELPGQPPTVADALPLTPGITRSPRRQAEHIGQRRRA